MKLPLRFSHWACALTLPLILLSACSTDVAGGTSEETNTVAGVVTGTDGKALAGAVVEIRALDASMSNALAKNSTTGFITLSSWTDTVYRDTTDANGNWQIALGSVGEFGAVIRHDSSSWFGSFTYAGKDLQLDGKLQKSGTLTGKLYLNGSIKHSPVLVGIPGTPWAAWSDSLGVFSFSGLPAGEYSVIARSPDPELYATVSYYIAWTPGSTPKLLGPLPSSTKPDTGWTTALSAALYSDSMEWELPMNIEYGLQGWWTLDYFRTVDIGLETPEARGRSGSAIVYGGQATSGYNGQALQLTGANQFAVVENDNNVLAGAKAFTVESWIMLDSLPTYSSSPRSLFGKLASSSQSLFSLAIVRGACSTEDTRLAFFLSDADSSELDCSLGIVSDSSISVGTWNHVAAVWDGQTLALYQNGLQVASRVFVRDTLPSTSLPVYFGKSDLSFRIDEVRWGTQPLRPVDIFYRYHMFHQNAWAK